MYHMCVSHSPVSTIHVYNTVYLSQRFLLVTNSNLQHSAPIRFEVLQPCQVGSISAPLLACNSSALKINTFHFRSEERTAEVFLKTVLLLQTQTFKNTIVHPLKRKRVLVGRICPPLRRIAGAAHFFTFPALAPELLHSYSSLKNQNIIKVKFTFGTRKNIIFYSRVGVGAGAGQKTALAPPKNHGSGRLRHQCPYDGDMLPRIVSRFRNFYTYRIFKTGFLA